MNFSGDGGESGENRRDDVDVVLGDETSIKSDSVRRNSTSISKENREKEIIRGENRNSRKEKNAHKNEFVQTTLDKLLLKKKSAAVVENKNDDDDEKEGFANSKGAKESGLNDLDDHNRRKMINRNGGKVEIAGNAKDEKGSSSSTDYDYVQQGIHYFVPRLLRA